MQITCYLKLFKEFCDKKIPPQFRCIGLRGDIFIAEFFKKFSSMFSVRGLLTSSAPRPFAGSLRRPLPAFGSLRFPRLARSVL